MILVIKFQYNFYIILWIKFFNIKINVITITYGYNCLQLYTIIISISLNIICH
jgi:hypothetical protein